MSKEEIITAVSAQLEEIHLGLASLMTTMDCLADSRTFEESDAYEAAVVLPTLTFVGRAYLDKLETVMLFLGRSEPAMQEVGKP